jgi:hypothetical protein
MAVVLVGAQRNVGAGLGGRAVDRETPVLVVAEVFDAARRISSSPPSSSSVQSAR